MEQEVKIKGEAASRYIAWLEKQKEQKELPLMNDDADLYFDTWRQEVPVPTFRQCFEEGMRYAQRLQKEQKPVDYDAELEKCKHNFLYFWDKYVTVKLKTAKWSKEDEEMLQSIIKDFRDGNISSIGQEQWLKSLPERFNLQSKQEWSEEDRLHYANVLEALEYVKGCKSDYDKIEAVKSDIAWLKALSLNHKKHNEAVAKLCSNEWSEKDKKIIDTIVSVLGQYIDYKAVSGTGSGYATPRYSKEIDWLNSLRPQYHGDVTMTEAYKMGKEAGEASHWKPSEEQMDALKDAVRLFKETHFEKFHYKIESLYEQLKKLM